MARSFSAQAEVNVKQTVLETDSQHNLSELLPGDDNAMQVVIRRRSGQAAGGREPAQRALVRCQVNRLPLEPAVIVVGVRIAIATITQQADN
jgi:hypothetical protein